MNTCQARVYSFIFYILQVYSARLILGVAWAFPLFTIINRMAKGIFFHLSIGLFSWGIFLKWHYQWKGVIKVLFIHCLFSRRLGPTHSVIYNTTQSLSHRGFTMFNFLSLGLKENLNIAKICISQVMICYVRILVWRLSEVTHSKICQLFFLFFSLLFWFRDFHFLLTNSLKK